MYSGHVRLGEHPELAAADFLLALEDLVAFDLRCVGNLLDFAVQVRPGFTLLLVAVALGPAAVVRDAAIGLLGFTRRLRSAVGVSIPYSAA